MVLSMLVKAGLAESSYDYASLLFVFALSVKGDSNKVVVSFQLIHSCAADPLFSFEQAIMPLLPTKTRQKLFFVRRDNPDSLHLGNP